MPPFRTKGCRRARLPALAVIALLVAPAVLRAQAVYVVDSTADEIDDDLVDVTCHTASGHCTLRAAVMQANKHPFGATIYLPAGTYKLSRLPDGANGADSGDLDFTTVNGTQDIAILGAGASSTVIDAQGLDRVLHVHPGARVYLWFLRLRGGHRTAGHGGGIYNEGRLSLNFSLIIDNDTTMAGGGIATVAPGELWLDFSEVIANQAGLSGGGVFAEASKVVIRDSTVSGNISGITGGGLELNQESHRVERSTISGNQANSGGGISVESAGATLFLTNSTLSANRAFSSGGGLFNAGTTWIYNATIVGNIADSGGGGVYNDYSFLLVPRNSVFANNRRLDATPDDCAGSLNTYGNNRFWTTAGCSISHFGAGSDGLMVSLGELGPLQFNGGPTRTHALVPASDLIDGGVACIDRNGSELYQDQRGGIRPLGGGCDIGAFEYDASRAGLIFADGFEIGGTWYW